jgi:hypothetical protein
MLDFIVDIVGQVMLAVVDGATQLCEDHLLVQKIPDRATPVRRRRRLRRKQQKKYGIEKQHFSQKMGKAHRK